MSESNNKALKFLILNFWVVLGGALLSYRVYQDGNGELLYYIAVLLVSFLFASISDLLTGKVSKIFLFASLFAVLLMYGFRDISGIDDPVYEQMFYSVSEKGFFEHIAITMHEPGYILLNYIIGLLTSNYIYSQIVISFISLYLFYRAFAENTNDALLGMAVFLMFCMLLMQMQSVALVRMFLAMGVVALSFKRLANMQVKRFVLYILIAASIHYSAFFLIFMAYFGLNEKALERRMLISYLLLAALMPLVMIFIVKFVVPVLGARHQQYADSEFNIKGSFLNTLPLIFACFYFFSTKFKTIYSKDFQKRAYYKILMFVFSLSLLIFLVASMAGVGRLVFYSYIAFILLVPIILKNIRRIDLFLVVSGLFVLYGYLYVYKTQFANDEHLPYFIPIKNILLG